MSVEPSNYRVKTEKPPATITAVVSEDEKATMRAKLAELELRRKRTADAKETLKVCREREAEAQEDMNRYCAGICDPQGLLGFGEPSDDGDTE